jgi:hypothetical protein
VIAGAADAGKTALLLNFIKLNQFDFSIYYQSSEMGKEELASRLVNFEDITLDEWNFNAEERSTDFADVIRPDCINIIDYMELTGDFYNVAEYHGIQGVPSRGWQIGLMQGMGTVTFGVVIVAWLVLTLQLIGIRERPEEREA